MNAADPASGVSREGDFYPDNPKKINPYEFETMYVKRDSNTRTVRKPVRPRYNSEYIPTDFYLRCQIEELMKDPSEEAQIKLFKARQLLRQREEEEAERQRLQNSPPSTPQVEIRGYGDRHGYADDPVYLRSRGLDVPGYTRNSGYGYIPGFTQPVVSYKVTENGSPIHAYGAPRPCKRDYVVERNPGKFQEKASASAIGSMPQVFVSGFQNVKDRVNSWLPEASKDEKAEEKDENSPKPTRAGPISKLTKKRLEISRKERPSEQTLEFRRQNAVALQKRLREKKEIEERKIKESEARIREAEVKLHELAAQRLAEEKAEEELRKARQDAETKVSEDCFSQKTQSGVSGTAPHLPSVSRPSSPCSTKIEKPVLVPVVIEKPVLEDVEGDDDDDEEESGFSFSRLFSFFRRAKKPDSGFKPECEFVPENVPTFVAHDDSSKHSQESLRSGMCVPPKCEPESPKSPIREMVSVRSPETPTPKVAEKVSDFDAGTGTVAKDMAIEADPPESRPRERIRVRFMRKVLAFCPRPSKFVVPQVPDSLSLSTVRPSVEPPIVPVENAGLKTSETKLSHSWRRFSTVVKSKSSWPKLSFTFPNTEAEKGTKPLDTPVAPEQRQRHSFRSVRDSVKRLAVKVRNTQKSKNLPGNPSCVGHFSGHPPAALSSEGPRIAQMCHTPGGEISGDLPVSCVSDCAQLKPGGPVMTPEQEQAQVVDLGPQVKSKVNALESRKGIHGRIGQKSHDGAEEGEIPPSPRSSDSSLSSSFEKLSASKLAGRLWESIKKQRRSDVDGGSRTNASVSSVDSPTPDTVGRLLSSIRKCSPLRVRISKVQFGAGDSDGDSHSVKTKVEYEGDVAEAQNGVSSSRKEVKGILKRVSPVGEDILRIPDINLECEFRKAQFEVDYFVKTMNITIDHMRACDRSQRRKFKKRLVSQIVDFVASQDEFLKKCETKFQEYFGSFDMIRNYLHLIEATLDGLANEFVQTSDKVSRHKNGDMGEIKHDLAKFRDKQSRLDSMAKSAYLAIRKMEDGHTTRMSDILRNYEEAVKLKIGCHDQFRKLHRKKEHKMTREYIDKKLQCSSTADQVDFIQRAKAMDLKSDSYRSVEGLKAEYTGIREHKATWEKVISGSMEKFHARIRS